MKLTREDVIAYLESLPGEELGKLADEVLARVGAPPIAPPVALPRHHDISMGAPLPDPHEIGFPTWELLLRDHGPDKLTVIRIIRRVLGDRSSLAAVKQLVESAPAVVHTTDRRGEAEDLAAELRRAGAVVELR